MPATDLQHWLEGLGFGEYAAAFAANDIDFSLLGQLTDADLKDLGVASLGHRKRLLAAIAERTALAPPTTSPVPTAGAAAGERRQVTILFADLSGFTALARSLDPEEVRELVDRFTALVDGIVLGYGGSIDKHIGDAVMALFGAPVAHGDDPLRAARAALDIHDVLARISTGGKRPLQAHIGIASGEVVAGTLGRADAHDYTVLGDSVNLAARLVATAGSGQTLLSESVYRALGGHAVCDALGELPLKGFDVPARVWRLRELAREPHRAHRGPFVGRSAELDQFRSIAAACLARCGGHLVFVRGEAGIGKTRLMEEMRRLAEGQGFVTHRGLVLDFGVGQGQNAVRALLRSLLGLSPDADTGAREEMAARLRQAGTIASEQAVFLNDLLDLPQTAEGRALYDAMDNAGRNRGKRAVISAVAAAACRAGPTLIVVEDLHWADPQVLTALAAFATAVADGPGILLMTSRVEGDPLDAAWRASCRVHLSPPSILAHFGTRRR